MVLDVMPHEADGLTSLPSHTTAAAQHRISTISNISSSRLLSRQKSQRKLQVRASHPALRQHQRVDDEATRLDMKKPSAQPAVQPKKSTSSLFNLFSKPKVEKARGYGGEAVPTPVLAQPKLHTQPKPSPNSKPPIPPYAPPPRPPSQLISPSPALRPPVAQHERPSAPRAPTQRTKVEEPTRQSSKMDKNSSWTAPPLFQAFARSVKHGLCETSISAADKNVARLKAAARERELEDTKAAHRNSLDSDLSEATRRTRMTVQTSRGMSSTHVDVPQKIVVLLHDGHLLQYSQHGPTNRLPEKFLQLGPDSAAFVSDTTANTPGALRIVQNTGTRAFSLQSTVNAFSRLTRRTMNPKRDVPNLLLAFRTSQEINEWLHAIRAYIDGLRRPLSTSSETASEKEQVDSVVDDSTTSTIKPLDTSVLDTKRNVNNEPSPIADRSDDLATSSSQHKPVPNASVDDDSDGSQQKGSLEIVEEEADRLLSNPNQRTSLINNAKKRMSDAPSFASSNAASIDAQALNNLRNSESMSHASGATNVTSRTNSMTSEPSSSNKASLENGADSASIKSPYRTLSSYQAAKRRSALPAVNTSQPIVELNAPDVTPPNRATMLLDSPLLGPASGFPASTVTTSRSSITRSPPAPSNAVSDQVLLESTPTIAEEDERPESIVADLPPPSTWTSKLAPKKRNSVGASVEPQQARPTSAALKYTPEQIAAAAASRRASHGFRLPLKINPNIPNDKPNPKNRNSMTAEAAADKPKVFTLEAKVDPKTHRVSVGQQSYSNTDLIKHRTSQRLSLFPSPLLSQTPLPEQLQLRSATLSNAVPLPPQAVPTRNASLQRPTSLQVRTNHAPFLSSVRTPTTASAPISPANPDSTDHHRTSTLASLSSPSNSPPADKHLSASPIAMPTRAAPIRQLKPSRSSTTISSMAPVKEYSHFVLPSDPFTSRSPPSQHNDTAVQIPLRRQSYSYRSPHTNNNASGTAPASSNSFAQGTVMRRASLRPQSTRQSLLTPLPGLEAFGPPAPPPNAPLPAVPNGAPPGLLPFGTGPIIPPPRSTARLSTQQISHGHGLGIHV